MEEGKVYEEPDFNRIIVIKEREAKRVRVLLDEINQNENNATDYYSLSFVRIVRFGHENALLSSQIINLKYLIICESVAKVNILHDHYFSKHLLKYYSAYFCRLFY